MASVIFDRKDVELLIGQKLKDDEWKEKVPMLGCPIEKITSNEIEVEIFPNRPDMLSAEGFARAISMFLGIRKNIPSYTAKNSELSMSVEDSVRYIRPYVAGAVVKNVKLTSAMIASLMQVQEKLHQTAGRKRKKVAIGVHDFDAIKFPLKYYGAEPSSIKFIPLEGNKEMTLTEILKYHKKGRDYAHILDNAKKYPVIIDKQGVISFPPIINSERTKVKKTTKNLFIDVTGTDEKEVNAVLNIIVTSLADRGCSIEKIKIGNKETPNLMKGEMKVNVNHVNKLLGTNMDKNEINEMLKKMGLMIRADGVSIPCYRSDIMHEIDIIEDVAIAHGYMNFEPEIPDVPGTGKRLEERELDNVLREIMVGCGFQEVINLILTNEDDEFDKMQQPRISACKTLNPVTVECTMLRTNILASLMKTITQNKHNDFPQKIFEVGEVAILDANQETGVLHKTQLGCVMSNISINYKEITSVLDAFMKNLGKRYNLKPKADKSFIDSRCAEIFVEGISCGVIGEIHPQVLNNWRIEMPCAGFWVGVDELK